MDMPPPPAQIETPLTEYQIQAAENPYKFYVLDRIDGPDIPEHVKKFAKDNNCNELMKSYHWTYVVFKNKGGVYTCGKNNQEQYIYDNGKTLRFARW